MLLADKATFPRDKPCGGGLTTRAFIRCPVDPTPVVEETVDVVELRFRYGDVGRAARSRAGHLHDPAPSPRRLSPRRGTRARASRFARAQRVEFGDGVRVGGEPVEADVVVGADGANGVTARALGLGDGDRSRGRARRERRLRAGLARALSQRRAVIELADIPGGYGWVFPKGDHVNVGVGAWQTEGPRLREHLERRVRAHGLRAATS